MTEAEKLQFYATILAGFIAAADPVASRYDQEYRERMINRAIQIGDELRAQLIDNEPSPF